MSWHVGRESHHPQAVRFFGALEAFLSRPLQYVQSPIPEFNGSENPLR